VQRTWRRVVFSNKCYAGFNAAVLNKAATRDVFLPDAQFIEIELLALSALSSPLPFPPLPPLQSLALFLSRLGG